MKKVGGYYIWDNEPQLIQRIHPYNGSWWGIPQSCPECHKAKTKLEEYSLPGVPFIGICTSCGATIRATRTLEPLKHLPKGHLEPYILAMEGQSVLDVGGDVDFSSVDRDGNYGSEPCGICNGEGLIWTGAGGGKIDCPYCDGRGYNE